MKNLIKTSAAVIAASLLGACNFAQPTPPCAVGHGGYGAKLTPVSGDTDTGPCARRGEIIGVQKYRQANGDQHIYLKPEAISAVDYFYGAEAQEFTALSMGVLDESVPNAEGFCTVGDMNAVTGNLVDFSVPSIIGEELTYQFSNVEFFVQGSVPGTQFKADLTITGAACEAAYTVTAMYPVIMCSELEDEATIGQPSEAACGPDQVDHIWSFVARNPLFAVECTPYGNPDADPASYDYAISGSTAWNICTPSGPVPSLIAGAN